jgi:hypothetical protein
VTIFPIAADPAGIGPDPDARRAGVGQLERRRDEIDAAVVRKMLGPGRREHLPHPAVDVEADRAESLDVKIGIVARRSVVARAGDCTCASSQ